MSTKHIKIDLYYDGTAIEENCGPEIDGFTTNISFLRAAGITEYNSFIEESLKHTQGRPISFQLFDDEDGEIEKSARCISSYAPSIFVKIPVIKCSGASNARIIKNLHDEGVPINVTAIFTKEQLDSIKDSFTRETNVIVSIFAGKINDCGDDAAPVVEYASQMFKEYPNVKILWAACRTVYNMLEAHHQGADIVTVPDGVLKRMSRLEENTHQASLDTVRQFRNDGVDGCICLDRE